MKIVYALLLLALSFSCVASNAHAQTTQISTDYLMTVYLPIEAKVIDKDLTIIKILPGGCVKGPRISGKIIAPSADWRRATKAGSFHMNVRLTIETDDGVLIYMTYGGVRSAQKKPTKHWIVAKC